MIQPYLIASCRFFKSGARRSIEWLIAMFRPGMIVIAAGEPWRVPEDMAMPEDMAVQDAPATAPMAGR